jgi:hypothetical protein
MTAETFRTDKYLRASGYNFYVWATVNLLITLPLWSALDGNPWAGWLAALFPVALLVLGVVLSGLNDNRVQKMWGDPSDRPLVEAGAVWGPIFLIGIVWTVVLAVRGPAAYIQPLWLLLVGAAYMTWGSFGVREFVWLGVTLVAAGAFAGFAIHPDRIAPTLPARAALEVWVVFMGVLWFPFGAYINWKYVAPRRRGSS